MPVKGHSEVVQEGQHGVLILGQVIQQIDCTLPTVCVG